MRLDPRDAVRFSALSSPDEILAGAANPYHAARPRRVSAAGLRPLQAKLSRNSNQIARGRIRQFESYMPSHAVGSLLRMKNEIQFTGIRSPQTRRLLTPDKSRH